ncbi:hypothetical protein [Rhizobium sp. SSA_523]|uniref:hypothetical protein n=1 Tax=Rhizobium sp. SSA_523 TaxID=2952477 RepID=UPI0020916BF3|nr:hypothetical protein [Rhizobium sp. SSA_523]MCO5730138.1 hypothetical protein [Rhizobium sp. SSA_523]WKC25202.1 hypothetical protein QTJ18_14545 [Rhizobium sp. SSA_523]
MRNNTPHHDHEEDLAEAIRAWHRGMPLSGRQIDLIDDARRSVLLRAHVGDDGFVRQ